MLTPSIFGRSFMDDFFDDMFATPFHSISQQMKPMSTDIQEFNDRYQLDFELPGFQKEDIHAELKDGYLTIKAEHQEDNDEKDEEGKFVRKERYSGSMQRSFYVGDQISEDEIKAAFENGILKIQVPKKEITPEVHEAHRISIEG